MRRFVIPMLAVAVLLTGAACREERAGEKVGRKLDEVVDKLRHPNEGPLEKLGRKTDEALDEAKEAIQDAREGD